MAKPILRLRFRCYVDGEIADESWVGEGPDTVDGALVAELHARICNAATDDGKLWVIEVYDPNETEEHAYDRFGPGVAGGVEGDLFAGLFRHAPPIAAVLIITGRAPWPPPSAN